ncbi:CAP domain-containing protein [Galbibacter sp. BG1]|uniref:CAP domain-containing protein n=1 Tax=Galbibacter sp. BG1 TaxID=1170699 RepID=UPI0015C115A0|nr:CAP domain-containing protein [Galbibacter sp. BG1]QLE01316.1 CAP domain-containing protein [Galbibacter sp. BG1]
MRKSILFIQFAIALLLVSSCSNESIQDEGLVEQTLLQTSVKEVEQDVHTIVNAFRIKEGLEALAFSEEAYSYAEEQTQFMINTGSFKHNNFNERASSLAQLVDAQAVAENIAKDYSTAEEAVNGWVTSPGHLKNIMGNFTHTSVSVANDKNGKLYYTQIFYRIDSE